jgi:hypothetical protein
VVTPCHRHVCAIVVVSCHVRMCARSLARPPMIMEGTRLTVQRLDPVVEHWEVRCVLRVRQRGIA